MNTEKYFKIKLIKKYQKKYQNINNRLFVNNLEK